MSYKRNSIASALCYVCYDKNKKKSPKSSDNKKYWFCGCLHRYSTRVLLSE